MEEKESARRPAAPDGRVGVRVAPAARGVQVACTFWRARVGLSSLQTVRPRFWARPRDASAPPACSCVACGGSHARATVHTCGQSPDCAICVSQMNLRPPQNRCNRVLTPAPHHVTLDTGSLQA